MVLAGAKDTHFDEPVGVELQASRGGAVLARAVWHEQAVSRRVWQGPAASLRNFQVVGAGEPQVSRRLTSCPAWATLQHD